MSLMELVNSVESSVPSSYSGPSVVVGGVMYAWDGTSYNPQMRQPAFVAMSGIDGIIGGTGASYGSAYTFTAQKKAKAKFIGIRVHFRHYGAAAQDVTLVKAAVAPASGNNGTALTWSAVTFANQNATQVPAALGSSPNLIQSPIASDAVGIGGNAGEYVQVRAYLGAGTVRIISTASLPQLNSDAGTEDLFLASAGDHVTTIDAQVPAVGTPSYVPFDIEFIYAPEVKAYTVMDVGDSRSRGELSTSNHLGPSVVAAKLAADGGRFVLNALNVSWSSQSRNASHVNLIRYLRSGVRPSFACVWFESPNDSIPQTAFDRSYGNAILAIQECQAAGVTPILCTPTPRNLPGGAALVSWQLQVSRARDFASRTGLPLCDYTAVLEDPAAPGQWIAAYKAAGDGTNLHASQAGYLAQGAELYRVISGLVG